jgi:hypothetical protein
VLCLHSLCAPYYTSAIRFLSLSTPINPLLESLGLTVCEDIENNVVTAHLAQPHLKLPRVVRSWCGRIEKGKRDLNHHRAYCPYDIFLSASNFFNRKSRRPSQHSSSAVVCPTPNSPPYCILSFEFFWLAYVFCIRNAASPTGSVLPRSFPPPRSG